MAAATESKKSTAAKAKPKPRPARPVDPPPKAKFASAATPVSAEHYAKAVDDVLAQVVTGGQDAIGATRRFITSVDEALPGSDEGPTRAHDVVDAALEMSDRMVESGGEAIRGIVRSLGGASK